MTWLQICPGYIGDDISRRGLVRRRIVRLRVYLYILGVVLLVFVAGITGHWDYLGYMLDWAVLMLLYLKGKEK